MTQAAWPDTLTRMRRLPLALLSALTVGCFSPEAPPGSDGSGDPSGAGTESGPTSDTESGTTMGSGPEDSTDTDTPTSMGSETDTSEPTGPGGDAPPVFEAFEVNGSTTPDDVTHSSMVQLTATVTDDVEVASVAFYDGDMLLGTVTEEPFELETLVTSVDNGGFVFRAVATDSAEQESESDEVQLFVDVDGGELWDVAEELFHGCQGFWFGGVAFVDLDRIVLGGTACTNGSDLTPVAFTIDAGLNVVADEELDGDVAVTATAMPSGEVLIPTATLQAQSVWRYLVFDPSIGAVQAGAGLQFPGSAGTPAATTVADGIFLQRSDTEVAVLEADLDSDIWTDTPGDASSPIATDGGHLFVLIADDGCAGAANVCIRKYSPDGSSAWTRGVQSAVFYQGLAVHPDGGVFYTTVTDENFVIGRLNADGDEVGQRVLSADEPRSTHSHIVADGQGGVVFAGAFGTPDFNNGGVVPTDQPVLMRLDDSLETVWERTDVGPGQSRVIALGNDGRGGLLLVGADGEPAFFGIEGEIWVGRANF